MARQSLLNLAEWQVVRDMSVSGCTDPEIILRFPLLTLEAIENRRKREDWPTPHRLHLAAKKAMALANHGKDGKGALQAIQQASEGRTIATFGSINRRVNAKMRLWEPKTPEKVSDAFKMVQILEKTARLAIPGSENRGNSINLAINVSPWDRQIPPPAPVKVIDQSVQSE